MPESPDAGNSIELRSCIVLNRLTLNQPRQCIRVVQRPRAITDAAKPETLRDAVFPYAENLGSWCFGVPWCVRRAVRAPAFVLRTVPHFTLCHSKTSHGHYRMLGTMKCYPE